MSLAHPRRFAGAAFVAVLLLLAGANVAVAGAAGNADRTACRTVRVPSGGEVVAGRLCVPTDSRPRTVMVLVSGATYGAAYWDVAVDPQRHNFRRAMNEGGYATFTVDKLGNGRSSVPPSAQLTTGRHAEAVHAVIGALRRGHADLPAYGSVILGGHSLGSTIVVTEASRYRDVDAVLLTGYGHTPNAVGLSAAIAGFVPAATEERFADRDPGYLTTRQGARDVFYGDGDVPPFVAAYDEATKEPFSVLEIPDAVATLLPVPPRLPGVSELNLPPTDGITAPVLLVNGADDKQFCVAAVANCDDTARFEAGERPYFPAAASFDARLISGAGHDLTLSVRSPAFQDVVLDWARRTTPPAGTT